MSIFSDFLDLLFPPRCVFCRRILNRKERGICAKCEETLPYCEGKAVFQQGEYFSKCVSPLYYRDYVRESLLRYKFKDAKNYVTCYGKLLARCISENYGKSYDLITWVPISEDRKKVRGYDQSMILALATALELEDVAAETIRKVRHVPAQSSLKERAQRLANVSNAYEATDPELFSGKRVLLIDDIVTSGATFSECARTLLLAGAEEVMCAAVARGEAQPETVSR